MAGPFRQKLRRQDILALLRWTPTLDLDVAIALLTGPFVQRRMVDRQEVTDAFRDSVLEHVVDRAEQPSEN